jgi:transcriptional regulator of NAD metabolism
MKTKEKPIYKGEKMKEYYVFEISHNPNNTENELDELAKKGWRLKWLIMERDKKVCKMCGK